MNDGESQDEDEKIEEIIEEEDDDDQQSSQEGDPMENFVNSANPVA